MKIASIYSPAYRLMTYFTDGFGSGFSADNYSGGDFFLFNRNYFRRDNPVGEKGLD